MSRTVSLDAARRQAFGVAFDATAKDIAVVEGILQGRLTLRPHPEWEIPQRLDWRADPFSDRNWRAQLHMLRWLDPLRRRADAGDVAAGARWVEIAQQWVADNHLAADRPPEAWMDMVDGIRALELCVAVPFVSTHFPEALDWLVPSIEEHLGWLADEQNHGHSNHALHQHQGLFVCALVLGDDAMARLAEERLEALFISQYDQEGVNAEGAIAYHLANLNWWAVARRRLETEGRPIPPSLQLLDQVPLELAHATKPDGTLVSIGDTDGGSVRGVAHPATRWVSTAGADGAPPDELVRLYEAGYLFARSGWGEHERDFSDETFWSMSFGAANRVHGHADGGSLTFSSMGIEWIADPGKFQYGVSPMRSYCLSREAHSLPVIEGRSYNARSVVECVRRDTAGSTYDFSFVDKGYDGVTLTRRVVYSVSGEYLVVIDTVDAEEPCTAVQHWLCGAGVSAERDARGFVLSAGEARGALLYTGTRPEMSSVQAQDDPVDGWVATGWKTRAPAPSLTFRKEGTRFRFVTLLAAGFRGATPAMHTVRDAPKGELRLRIETGRVAEQIVITAADSFVVAYSADATEQPRAARTRPNARPLRVTDPADRSRILEAAERARQAGFEGPEARDAAIRELELLQGEFDLSSGPDLGLTAAISDLRAATAVEPASLERPALVNWNASVERRFEPLDLPIVSVDSGRGLSSIEEETLVSFAAGPLVLPAVVSPAEGDVLTVLFHGAVDRARTRLPLFQRLRFQKSLAQGPTLSFSDPTLDLASDLRLAWYLGTDSFDLVPVMADAVQRVAERLGTKHVVLQGGSGGGFAAMQVGAFLPGAHAVAMSPQTDLRRYSPRFYRAAAEAALGLAEGDDELRLAPRLSVMRRIHDNGADLAVTLVMNTGDAFHEREHARPLRDFFAERSPAAFTEMQFDLGPGHRGLDNDRYASVMQQVYARVRGFDGVEIP